MSKAVLISIQPKYCELIASGKKTIDVRKTRPKLETPFKCYIYCTLPPRSELFGHSGLYEYAHELIRLQDGRIVYDYGMRLACEDGEYSRDNFLCQKVIGEFVCNMICSFPYDEAMLIPDASYDGDESRLELGAGYWINNGELESACLTQEELKAYGKGKTLYGIHITDMKI